jgi:adenylate cyclase
MVSQNKKLSRFSDKLDQIYGGYLTEARTRTYNFSDSVRHDSAEMAKIEADMYGLQSLIRPLYGKNGLNRSSIGHHPSFQHLHNTFDKEYCAITTMFIDIENSTRLSLLHPLEDVCYIKNSLIRSAIDAVKIFDGHVHRIMGDAVMAFFGAPNIDPKQGIVDGLNAAAFYQFFVVNTVLPRLELENYDTQFGVRIGLDHGPKEKVMWTYYGYSGMGELTATSLHVDMAAKLQHRAGRNKIMLGQSLMQTLNLPEELLSVKTRQSDGRTTSVEIVEPNHTFKDGTLLNYQMRHFDGIKYLKYSPLPRLTQAMIVPSATEPSFLVVDVNIIDNDKTFLDATYHVCSKAITKGRRLTFSVDLALVEKFPCTITFKVENHGEDAKNAKCSPMGNHITQYEVDWNGHSYIYSQIKLSPYTKYSTENTSKCLVHQESTLYMGLHYMIVTVYSEGREIQQAKLGIIVD